MNKPRYYMLLGVLLILVQIVYGNFIVHAGYNFDVFGRVARVVDGDTVYVEIYEVYSSMYSSLEGSIVKVRFADINAPELDTSSGLLAKKALAMLVKDKFCYLDIDDVYVYDKYGRIVAVLYLPLNKTHVLNVNLWLVLKGYAMVVDYKNEFNPLTWSLYITRTANNIQTKTTTKIITLTKTNTIIKTTIHTVAETYTHTVKQVETTTKTITKPSMTTITRTKTIVRNEINTNPVLAAMLSTLLIGLAIGYTVKHVLRKQSS